MPRSPYFPQVPLVFAGAKMLTSSILHVPQYVSLLAIAVMLAAAIVPSLAARRIKERASFSRPGSEVTAGSTKRSDAAVNRRLFHRSTHVESQRE